MPFSAGAFSLYQPGNPPVTGTTISSAWAANTLNDIATGLSTAVLKDGSQTLTANIPMSSFKLTGLAAGSASGDSLRYEQRYTNPLTLGTPQASTSGTSIDFTGIPAGTKRITINLVGVSLNGSSDLLFQLGDAGGFENSGYMCAGTTFSGSSVGVTNYTSGFGMIMGGTTAVTNGALVLTLENSSAFTWVASGNFGRSDATASSMVAGSKSTSAILTQVRITTVNGTDAFDAGEINIAYE